MTVLPARVNVLAPPVPTTVTWLFVEPETPWTRTCFGIAAPALLGSTTDTLFAWPAGKSTVMASVDLNVALLRIALADVVVNLDLAAGERHGHVAAQARIHGNLDGRQPEDDRNIHRTDRGRVALRSR